jgi:chromosome partitioning protein
MTRALAIANQKGGVGKTTTAVNVAAGLAQAGQRVLLVDLDPQSNATAGSGIDKRTLRQTIYQVLLGLSTAEGVRMRSESGDYDLLPANRELAGGEVEMVELENRELRLKSALAPIANQYGFILIDCPPALNLLTLNGLVAADAVVIPMQCEYYALEGLSDLINTIKKVRLQLNPRIEIDGLLRTMFDPRNTLAQQVSAQLEQHFGEKVYATIIPRNIRLAEAPSYGAPAVKFDASCKGSQAYLALTDEILGRSGVRAAALASTEQLEEENADDQD